MNSQLIDFTIMGDERGSLIALEEHHNAPFDIKRVFYIYGTQEGVPRGQHSHYKTKQYLYPQRRLRYIHKTAKVTIGKNVFNGSNVNILIDVTIGDNSVIANSSVVIKSIPSNVIAGGYPAKVIREIDFN